MNVYPTLVDHPKFIAFKNALKPHGVDAAEILLRLWGHCQTKQLGENWGKVSPGFVEAICRWSGASGELFAALTYRHYEKDGWAKLDARGNFIVCGWNEHNGRLVTNWRVGVKGGRKKSTVGEPNANPKKTLGLTVGEPKANPFDRSREDRSTVDGIGSELSKETLSPSGQSTFAEWPKQEEWTAYCKSLGLPDWKIDREWSNQERKRPKWDKIGNWQAHARHVKVLWEQDGRPMDPPTAARSGAGIKNAPSQSAQIYAWTQEKEGLMTALAEHPANSDSSAYNPQCGPEEKEDFKHKKARLRELFGLIANAGKGGGK